MELTPGLYADLPAADYHAAHDWLSASGAKKLVPPSCPAKFKAALEFGEERKPHFDLGTAAHTRILGKGEAIVVVDADDWRGKDAREARDLAYMEGKTPILARDNAVIDGMAASLEAHPIAPLLMRDGDSEVSAFWIDDATGVQCRARFDYLPKPQEGRRLVIPDLKTAVSSEPMEFARAAGRFHYAMQDQWYSSAVRALGLDPDPAFLFVVIEKDAPYIVTVCQLSDDDKRLGRALNDRARRIFRECTEADEWPTYHSGIADIQLPPWHHNAYEDFLKETA